jgi:hypothetical protein
MWCYLITSVKYETPRSAIFHILLIGQLGTTTTSNIDDVTAPTRVNYRPIKIEYKTAKHDQDLTRKSSGGRKILQVFKLMFDVKPVSN